jgi:NCS1 family nucleobase:cation symporter-1
MLSFWLLEGGMNEWEAVGANLLGNLVVSGPMRLNTRAGTKYKIPFPVLFRDRQTRREAATG